MHFFLNLVHRFGHAGFVIFWMLSFAGMSSVYVVTGSLSKYLINVPFTFPVVWR